jgi:hypothetical protein
MSENYLYVLPMQCVYLFCSILIITGEYFPNKIIIVINSQYVICKAGTDFFNII